MRVKYFTLVILLSVMLMAGCGDVKIFSQQQNYLLPKIIVETPAIGPDGFQWSINEANELQLEKENKSSTFAIDERLYIEKNWWQLVDVEDNWVILKPVVEEPDPMIDIRRKLD